MSLHLAANPASKSVVAKVELARAGAPKEIHVKLPVPKQTPLRRVTANGQAAELAGRHGDTVVIATGGERHFEVVGQWS